MKGIVRKSGFTSLVLGGAVVAALTFWAYAPAFHGGWLWDDGLEVARNPVMKDPQGWWKVWVQPTGLDYLPLKDFFLWCGWRVGHGTTEFFHGINVGLHLLGSFLVARVLFKLGVRSAWVGGLLFAVHPLAVESVAWISEFKNVLSLPFMLAAFGAFIDYDEQSGGIPTKRSLRSYHWSVLLFALALLCKTSVILLPLVLLLYIWWRRGTVGRSDIGRLAPFFLLALVSGWVALHFQWHHAMRPGEVVPPGGPRVLQAGWSLIAYFASCLLPVTLAPIYLPAISAWRGILGWGATAGVLVWLVSNRKTPWARHALLGVGWFILNLIPELGIVPLAYLRVSPRADHWAYLSLVGIVGLAAAGYSACAEKLKSSRRFNPGLLAGCLGAIALAGAFKTRSYAAVFRSDRDLWIEAVVRAPSSWLARANLGQEFLAEGKPEAALPYLETAGSMKADSGEVQANLGLALESLGQRTEALVHYRAAVAIDPDDGPFHYDLGKSLLLAGDLPQAERELAQAIRLDPPLTEAHNNLGLVYARTGRTIDATREYKAALALRPDFPEAHLNLGNVLFKGGDPMAAEKEYRAALATNPTYEGARQNLAKALEALNRPLEARPFETPLRAP